MQRREATSEQSRRFVEMLQEFARCTRVLPRLKQSMKSKKKKLSVPFKKEFVFILMRGCVWAAGEQP
jgi:hypothetical protein